MTNDEGIALPGERGGLFSSLRGEGGQASAAADMVPPGFEGATLLSSPSVPASPSAASPTSSSSSGCLSPPAAAQASPAAVVVTAPHALESPRSQPSSCSPSSSVSGVPEERQDPHQQHPDCVSLLIVACLFCCYCYI